MTREQQGVVLFLSLGLILFFWLNLPSSMPPHSSMGTADGGSSREGTGEKITVEIDGSVQKKGIYHLEAGARISEAVKKAGGISGGGNLASESFRPEINDGSRVYVQAGDKQNGKVTVMEPLSPAKKKILSIPININTANFEEFNTLPGIGPQTAQAIVDYRAFHGPFQATEDLMKVRGIGAKKFTLLRPHVTL